MELKLCSHSLAQFSTAWRVWGFLSLLQWLYTHHIHGENLRYLTLSISKIHVNGPRVQVSCCIPHSYVTVCFHHAGISEAQSNVDRLRQILESVTTGVQEGRAEQQHQRQLALSRRQKPVSYSPWLSQPFLKVCSLLCFPAAPGLAGILSADCSHRT